MGNCAPRLGGGEFELPDLKARNYYGTTEHNEDDRLTKTIFPLSYEENKNSRLPEIIQKADKKLFEDQHFSMNERKSLRLSILFNYETNRTRIYTKRDETDIIQLNIEFTYLTSVFYLLCNRKAKAELLPRLVENQETNNNGIYSTHLWCNGEPHTVIIDDRMPTHNDNFLFLRVVKGIELWPLILEKAWVKMIGSYEAALGLSPEESFEELTGIPAYTYTIRANNREFIRRTIQEAKERKYWIALIAHPQLKDLQSKQVFLVENVEYNEYKLISPYVSYQFEKYNQSRRGEVIVREDDIFSHFEHVVIGFCKDGYVPLSLPVTCDSREEVIFELNVRKEEEVSIRFNQLYHGYLKPDTREYYQYSPVLIELYEAVESDGERKKFKLKDFCQGCNRSLLGARSSRRSISMQSVANKS
jgi:hypothetical protein